MNNSKTEQDVQLENLTAAADDTWKAILAQSLGIEEDLLKQDRVYLTPEMKAMVGDSLKMCPTSPFWLALKDAIEDGVL